MQAHGAGTGRCAPWVGVSGWMTRPPRSASGACRCSTCTTTPCPTRPPARLRTGLACHGSRGGGQGGVGGRGGGGGGVEEAAVRRVGWMREEALRSVADDDRLAGAGEGPRQGRWCGGREALRALAERRGWRGCAIGRGGGLGAGAGWRGCCRRRTRRARGGRVGVGVGEGRRGSPAARGAEARARRRAHAQERVWWAVRAVVGGQVGRHGASTCAREAAA